MNITQNLTLVNKGKKGDNKPEWIVCHFVGASGQSEANGRYFKSVYRGASAHYFVDPKTIVQVVENDTPAWHVGDGSRSKLGKYNGYVMEGGATNTNSIGIEMCQDTTTGKDVWHWDFHPDTVKNAEGLIRKLQKKYDIDDNHVIRHFDVSGKICPGNWRWDDWAKWEAFKDRLEKDVMQPAPTGNVNKPEGKHEDEDMHLVEPGDTLWSIAKTHGVKVDDLIKWNDLEDKNLIFPETKLFVKSPKVDVKPKDDLTKLAKEVIDGKHGVGDARKKALGSNYDAVQKLVNQILLGKQPVTTTTTVKTPVGKSVTQLAQEVIDGKHGTGDARKKSLGASYDVVQKKVNEMLKTKSSKPKAKTIDELVEEVLRGVHGSGRERMISLGSKYAAVQREVNKRLR